MGQDGGIHPNVSVPTRSDAVQSAPFTAAQALAEAAWRRGLLDRNAATALAGHLAELGCSRSSLLRLSEAQPVLEPLLTWLPSSNDRRGGCLLLAQLSGAGGSLVWLAERAGTAVVVKELRPELATSLAFRGRFQREIHAVARLDDPHLVPCLEHGSTRDGTPWFAMAYVRGGDLEQLLRRAGNVSVAEALLIARHLALGLIAAHRAGIIHRGVKPANVLIGEDGRCRLADFGLAVPAAEQGALTMQGMVVGTPAWLAPERVRGHEADIRADIYAVGAILYACLAGMPPFIGTRDHVLRAHLSAPVPDVRTARSDVGPGVAKLILKCLAKDPADRYQTPDHLHASLLREAEPAGRIDRLPAERIAAALPAVPAAHDANASPATLRGAPLRFALSGRALTHPRLTLLSDGLYAGHVLCLLAQETAVFGAELGDVDGLLRGEHGALPRVSRNHARFACTGEGSSVVDLDSTNGTVVDSTRLPPRREMALSAQHTVRLADAVELAAHVVGASASADASEPVDGPDALVLLRRADRPRQAWALVRRQLSIGGPGADVPLHGLRDAVRIQVRRSQGCWWWRATADATWQAVAAGEPIPLGSLRLLPRAGEAGDAW